MNCDVAREALSARIDGEREPVPSARVDEHIASCARCAAWYERAREQTALLHGLAGAPRPAGNRTAVVRPPRRPLAVGLKSALVAVGAVMIGVAVAQLLGADFGLVAGHHGVAGGTHLLNESTAWSAAVGVALIAAAWRPVLASGVACVSGVYALLLAYFVTADALAGQVTAGRVVSHLPVVLGAVLVLVLWRIGGPGRAGGDVREALGTDSLSDRRLRASEDPAA
ncbi:zf-HC2 domain-containing protein [Mycobacterium sp. Y57]|uniref:zf-HC2 domain-containing protein n=1 Tax=Mycolicibacterium xanthum TaxID=2796469 RepID=UPI001C85D45E|nr:zf-HC2 domain-containing protein [Mycolicibacterium xanthum]MBX7433191.1 zf-HC2 domain-containing protein [Mycolicibacterium xanthum]